MFCILSVRFVSQVYDSLCRPYPRRFVLPLHVSEQTPAGQNLNTRPSSQATCVKVGRDQASQNLQTVQLFLGSSLQLSVAPDETKEEEAASFSCRSRLTHVHILHCGASVTWSQQVLLVDASFVLLVNTRAPLLQNWWNQSVIFHLNLRH